MTTYHPPRGADDINPKRAEAEARRLMREHAAIEPRGFDTIARRSVLHRQIDALLDAHALIASFVIDEELA